MHGMNIKIIRSRKLDSVFVLVLRSHGDRTPSHIFYISLHCDCIKRKNYWVYSKEHSPFFVPHIKEFR